MLLADKRAITPWIICICGSLFFFYEIFQVSMFNVLSADLMQAYNISSSTLGSFSSAYFYANFICVFPISILMNRLSIRKVLLFYITVVVMATFVFAFSHSLTLSVICRAIVGVGNGIAFIACMSLPTRWFPSNRYALVMGVCAAIGMLGGMASQAPFALLVKYVSWQQALFFVGFMGVVILFLVWAFVKDQPDALVQQAVSEERPAAPQVDFWKGIGFALKSAQNWLCGLYTGILNLTAMVLAALWGILYLTQARNLTAIDSSKITGMIFLGLIVGSPVIGWISDRLHLRKIPMLVGSFVLVVLVMFVIELPNVTVNEFMLIFFLLGFFSSFQALAYPLAAESNPLELTSICMGILSILFNICLALGQQIFGWIIHFQESAASANQVSHVLAVSHALWMLPIAFALSFIAAMMVKETGRKEVVVEA